METFLQQLIEILTTLPASLFFHLGLAAFLIAALQPALIAAKLDGNPAGVRLGIGISLLILGQITLIAGGGFGWQHLTDPHALLPILDRLIFTFSLLWIGWMWAYPYRKPAADAACGIASILLLILFAISLTYWGAQGASTAFNQSWLDLLWAGISLAGIVGLSIPLAIRKPAGWYLGFVAQGLLAVGILAHLYLPPSGGDLSGFMRLAQLAAFPLLLVLPYRGRLSRPVPVRPPGAPLPRTPERRRFSTDGKTLRAFLSLASETDPGQLGAAITRLIGHVMVADLCYLSAPPDRSESITLEVGYDLIREAVLSGASIPTQGMPELTTAIQHGKPLRLSSEVEIPRDLKCLGEHLNLADTGNLFFMPLLDKDSTPVGGLLLLSPYSHRIWTLEDQTYLHPVSAVLTHIIERVQNTALLQNELTGAHDEMQQALANTFASAIQPGGQAEDLPTAIEPLPPSPQPDLETLLAIQQEYQDIINRLQTENIHLHEIAAHASSSRREWGPGEDWHMEKDLHQALDQVARLQNALDEAQGRIQLLEGTAHIPRPEDSKPELSLQEVDLLAVIDQTVAEFSREFREKGLNLLVNIPESLPTIQADPGCLQEVIRFFVANASQVSPLGGTISLEIQAQQKDGEPPFVGLRVKDSGGGIPTEDLPRFFACLFSAQVKDIQIQGFGASIQELAEVRALVEAHAGHLWVDTENGKSTTFHFTLPIHQSTPQVHPA